MEGGLQQEHSNIENSEGNLVNFLRKWGWALRTCTRTTMITVNSIKFVFLCKNV